MTASTRESIFSVASYIARHIQLCGKPQYQIAKEAGYENPNNITMLKQGRTKVPLTKVGPLARALGVDPAELMRLVLREYVPETWSAIEDAFGEPAFLTEGERALIIAIRAAMSSGLADTDCTGVRFIDRAFVVELSGPEAA